MKHVSTGNKDHFRVETSGYATWFTDGVQSASLYDSFCKTGNYVIYDVIIWVQDGNCKKWLERILVLVRSTT